MNPEPRSQSNPLSVSQPDHPDDIRSAFEAAYLSGESPSIERFLEDTPRAERPAALRKLLRLALEYDRKQGEQPSRDDYLTRFPQDGAIVEEVFADLDERPAEGKHDSTGPTDGPTPRHRAAHAHSDHNLLFGIPALQNRFIDRDALVAAFDRWTTDKGQPLGAILIALGKLDTGQRAALDALVAQHVKLHGDAEKSLAAVGPLGAVRDDLQQIADPDVQASLAGVPPAPWDGAAWAASLGSATMAGTTATAGTSSSAGTRFTLLRPHATGGLGRVSVALDEVLNREVAFKEIQERYADDSGSRSRFLLEAEVTGGLEHPGIVPVYGLGHFADGRPFYAMRFIQGESLQAAIKRFHGKHKARGASRPPVADVGTGQRAVEFRQLLGRFVDVCNAIEYAHSRGVLHRDLKPGNVMLGKYGETLVVDWGLAKVVGRAEPSSCADERTLRPASAADSALSVTGQALGTPQFMSPEQAAGRLDLLSRASDVYGLGATLYSLLTGQAPFEHGETADILARVARGDFRPPRAVNGDVPRALDAICVKAMSLKPPDRYDSPRPLADDLERWLADEPITAHHETALQRAAAAALVLVTAVSIGAAVLIDQSRRAEQVQRVRADDNATRAIEAEARVEKNAAAEKQAMQAIENQRQAIDRYIDTVRESELVNDKRFQPMRRKLLQDALRYYQEFIREHQHDAAARADLADAVSQVAEINYFTGSIAEAVLGHQQAVDMYSALVTEQPGNVEYAVRLGASFNQLGVVQSRTSEHEFALANYRQALSIRERLASASPAVAKYQTDLARSYNNLANLQNEMGDRESALAGFGRALAICEKLAAENPDAPEHQRGLATAYNNLGRLQRETGNRESALDSHRHSVMILERLAAASPTSADYQKELAIACTNLGHLLRDTGDRESASESYHQALAIRQRLATAHPEVEEYQVELGGSYRNYGKFLRDGDRPAEALDWYARALEALEAVVRREPKHVHARRSLQNAHTGRATAFSSLRRDVEAADDWRRAAELADEATQPILRLRAADALVHGGDHAAAAAAVEELTASEQLPGELLYNAACVMALSAAAAKDDEGAADRYAARAVELLKRSQAAHDARQDQNQRRQRDGGTCRHGRGKPRHRGGN